MHIAFIYLLIHSFNHLHVYLFIYLFMCLFGLSLISALEFNVFYALIHLFREKIKHKQQAIEIIYTVQTTPK